MLEVKSADSHPQFAEYGLCTRSLERQRRIFPGAGEIGQSRSDKSFTRNQSHFSLIGLINQIKNTFVPGKLKLELTSSIVAKTWMQFGGEDIKHCMNRFSSYQFAICFSFKMLLLVPFFSCNFIS